MLVHDSSKVETNSREKPNSKPPEPAPLEQQTHSVYYLMKIKDQQLEQQRCQIKELTAQLIQQDQFVTMKASSIEQLEDQVKHKITEIDIVNQRNLELEVLNNKLKEMVDSQKHMLKQQVKEIDMLKQQVSEIALTCVKKDKTIEDLNRKNAILSL